MTLSPIPSTVGYSISNSFYRWLQYNQSLPLATLQQISAPLPFQYLDIKLTISIIIRCFFVVVVVLLGMEGGGCRLCNIHHFPLKCHTVFFLHCAQHTHRVARASSSSSSPFSSAFHTWVFPAPVMMQIWVRVSLPLPYSVEHKAVLFGDVSRPISVHTVMLTYFCPCSHLPPSL